MLPTQSWCSEGLAGGPHWSCPTLPGSLGGGVLPHPISSSWLGAPGGLLGPSWCWCRLCLVPLAQSPPLPDLRLRLLPLLGSPCFGETLRASPLDLLLLETVSSQLFGFGGWLGSHFGYCLRVHLSAHPSLLTSFSPSIRLSIHTSIHSSHLPLTHSLTHPSRLSICPSSYAVI